MSNVYLGLGANMGDRAANIRRALSALGQCCCTVLRMSSLYETEPWGLIDQPRFINAACLIETSLDPLGLLDTLKEIERFAGRIPSERNGPRPIDLDILLFDDLVLASERLAIPHAGMLERSTVLVPMAEIAPTVRHPLSGCTMLEHLGRLGPTPDVALYPPGLTSPTANTAADTR